MEPADVVLNKDLFTVILEQNSIYSSCYIARVDADFIAEAEWGVEVGHWRGSLFYSEVGVCRRASCAALRMAIRRSSSSSDVRGVRMVVVRSR